MIFSSQLAKELEWWKQSDTAPKPEHLLLQHMDDFLTATGETLTCFGLAIGLLNSLGLTGYQGLELRLR